MLTVRVIPRSGKAGIVGTRDGALLIRLTAPPVEGAANQDLIEILADVLGLPKRSLRILSGERSRRKRVLVEGIDVESIRQRLRIGDW